MGLHLKEIIKHKFWVIWYLFCFSVRTMWRGVTHDLSKLTPVEAKGFAKETPLLNSLKYDSTEYHESRKRLDKSLDAHYANNRHHPEHFKNGIESMDLVDIVEMLCDWRAAVRRHADGDIHSSIAKNHSRFKMPWKLVKMFHNTIGGFNAWKTNQAKKAAKN